MRKRWTLIFTALFLVAFLASCSRDALPEPDPSAGRYTVWYLGTGYRLVPDVAEAGTGDTVAVAEKLLTLMRRPRPDLEGGPALPSGSEVTEVTADANTLTVNFDSGYTDMEPSRELLCRAALVLTLSQIPQVSRVGIAVDGQRLTDASGRPIGPFSAADFLNVSGVDVNMNTEAELTVYFAMGDSPFLVGETHQVTYSGLSSVGEYLMDMLIAGPEREDLRPVLPEGTRVLDLTVRSGVCYLNLSPGPRLPDGISPELSLYGIVDSLTTVANITSVQMLIDNSQEGNYFGIPVKDAFTHNLDYIAP